MKINFPCNYREERNENLVKTYGCGTENYQYRVKLEDYTEEDLSGFKALSKKGVEEDKQGKPQDSKDAYEFSEKKINGYESFSILSKKEPGAEFGEGGTINISKFLYILKGNKLITITGQVIRNDYNTPKEFEDFFNSLELK